MPRQRKTNDRTLAGYRYTIYKGDVPVQEYFNSSGVNDTLNISAGHYGYPRFPYNKDIGGPFWVSYSRYQNGSVNVGNIGGRGPYYEYRYRGSVYTQVPTAPLPAYLDGTDYGAKAFNRMKPDKPNMNLLNSIYELKDVPGMIRQRFHGQALHEVGDYYLALKFGWEALLKDVRDFILTTMNAQKRYEQLLRDEGRPVKRRIRLNASTTTNYENTYVGNRLFPGFVSYFYATGGSYVDVSKTNDEVWASARFRYYLPDGPRNIEWKSKMFAAIFGLKPTPAAVYKAIPWSWLVDWYVNIGDVLSNLDTTLVDRLAADYFYVMRKVETELTQTCSVTYYLAGTLNTTTVTAIGHSQAGHKTRLKGDPFGFATQQNSLSGVQLSILGALGLSKLR